MVKFGLTLSITPTKDKHLGVMMGCSRNGRHVSPNQNLKVMRMDTAKRFIKHVLDMVGSWIMVSNLMPNLVVVFLLRYFHCCRSWFTLSKFEHKFGEDDARDWKFET